MKIVATIAGALALVCMCGPASPASAADISLYASNAINAALGELVPQFERTSGHKVTMRLGVASALRKEIEAGAAFDVAILVGSLDGLVAQGKVVAGTPVALGRSGYGLAVRAGAPKPDIGTTEAFKRTLLNAKSVGYTEGGGSGTYFVRLLNKLGDRRSHEAEAQARHQHAGGGGARRCRDDGDRDRSDPAFARR